MNTGKMNGLMKKNLDKLLVNGGNYMDMKEQAKEFFGVAEPGKEDVYKSESSEPKGFEMNEQRSGQSKIITPTSNRFSEQLKNSGSYVEPTVTGSTRG